MYKRKVNLWACQSRASPLIFPFWSQFACAKWEKDFTPSVLNNLVVEPYLRIFPRVSDTSVDQFDWILNQANE